MSACEKFRNYLAMLSSQSINESPGELARTFDGLHQSSQENTGQNCTVKNTTSANVYMDITKEGKTVTKDVYVESIDELKEILYDLQVHSRFQAEIYMTDGVIRINVKK